MIPSSPDREEPRMIMHYAPVENPRPSGAEKLTGGDDTYHIHVGDYRILYEIHDTDLMVLVIEAGHRREVYRNYKRAGKKRY
jgi:addiction module RelE/StbE family toxin